MKVLVIGASNFIGAHVTEQLKLAGHEVTALITNTANHNLLKGMEVEYVKWIDDIPIEKVLKDQEVVCNCTSYELFHQSKILDLENEIEKIEFYIKIAAQCNVSKFIHLSSTLLYELENLENITESYKPSPNNKLQILGVDFEKAVESSCKKHNLESIILRPANPIGSRDESSFFTSLLTNHERNSYPLIQGGFKNISLIDVRDIGRAMEWLVKKKFTFPHNVFLLKGFDTTWYKLKLEIDVCMNSVAREDILNTELNKLDLQRYNLTPFTEKIFSINRVWDDSKIREHGFKTMFSLRDAISSSVQTFKKTN